MDLKPPNDITINASLGPVKVSPRSTASGMKGELRFDISQEDAAIMVPFVGSESFAITFHQTDIGDGYTLAPLTIRPDAGGSGAVATMKLLCPETSVQAMALLIARSLVGAKGKLVMSRAQTTMSDNITTAKAGDPTPIRRKGAVEAGVASGDLLPLN